MANLFKCAWDLGWSQFKIQGREDITSFNRAVSTNDKDLALASFDKIQQLFEFHKLLTVGTFFQKLKAKIPRVSEMRKARGIFLSVFDL